mgnify:CR=1
WINRKKLDVFKQISTCSFLNTLSITDLYSNGLKDLKALYDYVVNDNNFESTENCSIFDYDSLNPKKIFKQ